MSALLAFDEAVAHRQFSTRCFNQAWNLIDRPARDPAARHEMLMLALSSLWHWTQRSDVTPRNLGIGRWQVARVLALLGQVALGREFAESALAVCVGDEPFYEGYAHEGCARIEILAGRWEPARTHLDAAERLAAQVVDEEDRARLLDEILGLRQDLARLTAAADELD
jgi:hypothetical protein